MLKSKRINRDRKITIMQPVAAVSVSGGPKFSGYEEIDSDPTPYARVHNKMGEEVIQSDQITHVQQTVFTVLYRTDITSRMVIVHQDKMYAIHSYIESSETRRQYLDIVGEYFQDYVIT